MAYANELNAPFASEWYLFYIPVSMCVKRMVETARRTRGKRDSLMDCDAFYFLGKYKRFGVTCRWYLS
jgi:hypothetical protein